MFTFLIKTYVLIFLLPIPSALLASDIALPKISNDMQKLAKEATSNARIKALNVQKVTPKPSKKLVDQVEKLLNQAKKQAETQKNTAW
jgi:D-ribose pyranose/furanose isomerase RbsD